MIAASRPSALPARHGEIRRQVSLPMSKAVEIAWKSIRLRLSRSLVVTSGIVLALAFLMSILAGEAIVGAMRQWIANAPASPAFQAMRQERAALDARWAGDAAIIAGSASHAPLLSAHAKSFDARAAFGADWPELEKDIGRLPASPEQLSAALTNDPTLVDIMKRWADTGRQINRLRARINRPDMLRAILAGAGVPTDPAEVHNAAVQTRWLVGLALLVAFVGILNAMLMSVTERFREIGTMKCLGALNSFIIKLFLIESLFQGLVGTAVGVMLGLGLSFGSALTSYGKGAFIDLPWARLAADTGICLLAGVVITVIGAVYPVWTAARMQPIEAMRVDV